MQSHYIEVAQGGVSMVEQYTIDCECLAYTLVTQPMLQRQPNRTELRLMDSYIQILCRFQKCKQKVPPPSLLNNEKSPFTPPPKDEKNLPLGG